MARSRFHRAHPQQRPKRLFVVSTEGYRTEPVYLGFFNQPTTKGDYSIKILNHRNKNHLDDILGRLIRFRKQKNPGRDTDYWMVLDKDRWTDIQLDQICAKAKRERIGVALSNPCFEHWLYLHFADTKPFNGAQDCFNRLKQVFPTYEKNDYDVGILVQGLGEAVARAEQLDTSPNTNWPREQESRMYKLMKQLKKYGLEF